MYRSLRNFLMQTVLLTNSNIELKRIKQIDMFTQTYRFFLLSYPLYPLVEYYERYEWKNIDRKSVV